MVINMKQIIKEMKRQIAASDALWRKTDGRGMLAQILANELIIMKKLVADEKQQQNLKDSFQGV